MTQEELWSLAHGIIESELDGDVHSFDVSITGDDRYVVLFRASVSVKRMGKEKQFLEVLFDGSVKGLLTPDLPAMEASIRERIQGLVAAAKLDLMRFAFEP